MPFRTQADTRQRPASSVNPVFTPTTVSSMVSSLLELVSHRSYGEFPKQTFAEGWRQISRNVSFCMAAAVSSAMSYAVE